MFTIGIVWYAQRPFARGQATWEDVMAEAKAGGYRIITTDDLAKHYRKDASGLLLVDTRQEWEYRTGHIQGRAELFHGTHPVGALAQNGRV